MNEITTVGVDLAKIVIVVCAAGRSGQVTVFKQFSFALLENGRQICRLARSAWRRAVRRITGRADCTEYGHTTKLIAGELVKPFRKSKAAKNERNDAEAIMTALRQPNMRFVGVKSADVQAMLAWHRLRQGFSMERTALINRARGLLAEFGVWLRRSPNSLLRALAPL